VRRRLIRLNHRRSFLMSRGDPSFIPRQNGS
jgi:hypothetical protein